MSDKPDTKTSESSGHKTHKAPPHIRKLLHKLGFKPPKGYRDKNKNGNENNN